MPGVTVKVDDRVIMAAAASFALIFGLMWHRSYRVARLDLRPEATTSQCDPGDKQTPASRKLHERNHASRLLELYSASLHDTARPFCDLPLIQAAAEANNHFASGIALLVERNCTALNDFTGEYEQPQAIVIGCGTGGVALSLAESFPLVLAIDSSQQCIDAAKALQDQGCLSYRTSTGSNGSGSASRRLAKVAPDIDCSRVTFMRADPHIFVEELEQRSADAVIVTDVDTSLPCPEAMLKLLPPLLRPGGIVCIVTDDRWQPDTIADEYLPKSGFTSPGGQQLSNIMKAASFILIAEKNLPAAIRVSERFLQLSVYHCTLWRQGGDIVA